MSKTRLIFLPDDPDGSAASLTFNADGRVIARGVLRSGQDNPPDLARDVIVVSGIEVVAHRVALPMRSEKQARATAAVLLEEQMASPGAEAHLALGAPTPDGQRWVAVASRQRMRAWLDQAARLGVRPAAMVPTYALIGEPLDGSVAAATILPTEIALRGPGLAAAVEPELFATLVGERRVGRIDDPAELEQALAAGATNATLNLLQGEFALNAARATAPRDFRRVAVLAAVLLVSPLLLLGAQIARDRWAVSDHERQAQALADRLAPGADQGLDPLERLHRREARLAGGQGFIDATAVLFTLVEQLPGSNVVSLYYGAGGQTRATIAHPNYSDVDALKRQAARYGFQLTEDSTATENDRVVSDIILKAGR